MSDPAERVCACGVEAVSGGYIITEHGMTDRMEWVCLPHADGAFLRRIVSHAATYRVGPNRLDREGER